MSNRKRGKIAFITTPQYRESNPQMIRTFIYENMYSLCSSFNVMATGQTSEFVKNTVGQEKKELSKDELGLIAADLKCQTVTANDYKRWRQTILDGLETADCGFRGMIHVAYELVEGRLDAIIHLTDWQDISAKPDSAVLAREANVHNVPIAHNYNTATSHVRSWKSKLEKQPTASTIFPRRKVQRASPLRGMENRRVLAMVAHDNMKLELCRFAVEKRRDIFNNYDYVLATGTTGSWLKKFMLAAGQSKGDIERIRCCNSGPLGGDIQIAYAVTQGWCQRVVFLQDPSVSHPHDSDIRLFEQAVVDAGVEVELATNVECANLFVFAP